MEWNEVEIKKGGKKKRSGDLRKYVYENRRSVESKIERWIVYSIQEKKFGNSRKLFLHKEERVKRSKHK